MLLNNRKTKLIVAALTATISNFAFSSSELDLVVINEGATQNIPPHKILSRLPNEMVGTSLDYAISQNPFEDEMVLVYDVKRRSRSVELFSKAYAFSVAGLKDELRKSYPQARMGFEEPNVSYVLNKTKPGRAERYDGLTQYFLGSDVKDKSDGALSNYAVVYQYEAYLRLAYNYLSKSNPDKATRDYASLLAAFHVMKEEGIDAFYPLYRYEVANFFRTSSNDYATSAWMLKVAASYYNSLDQKGVIAILDKGNIKSQVYSSLLSVSAPNFDYLKQSFSLAVYQNGFYEYYNLLTPNLINEYSGLYDSRNCLSLMPQVTKDSVLYNIEKATSTHQVCELSKQISKRSIDDRLVRQLSRDHSMNYIKNGKVDPKLPGSYGAMLLSDLSYVVDISGVGR